MKKLFFFIFCCFINKNLQAQLSSPLYIMFDTTVVMNYAEPVKYIDVPQAENYSITNEKQTEYVFISETSTHTRFLRNQIYGGFILGLTTKDRDHPIVINASQLGNYNAKTYDQLVEIFDNIPIADQKIQFWNRPVYIVEKIDANTYHIFKVEITPGR